MLRRSFLPAVTSLPFLGGGGRFLSKRYSEENCLRTYSDYMARVPIASKEDVACADAFVVFTGDRNRLPEAIRLCNSNQKLFISALKRGATWGDVTLQMMSMGCPVRVKEENVTFDYDGWCTTKNAERTGNWLGLPKNYDIKNIVVVTSDYHMPRSMVELNHFLPDRVKALFHPTTTYEIPPTRETYITEGRKILCYGDMRKVGISLGEIPNFKGDAYIFD